MRYAIGPLFLIAVFFVATAPVFWRMAEVGHGNIPETSQNSRLFQYVYPAFHHAFGRLSEGEIPLWNSRQLCGTPLQADHRLGLFQPLNCVFVWLPTELALALHAFLSLLLMGSFFALFARSLGVHYVPALIGGVAYAFCGASAAAMSRPALAAALAWTPFVFWAVREYARRARYSMAVLAGVGTAGLVLSGAYAVVLAMAALLFPYAVIEARFRPCPPVRSRGGRLLGWMLLAVVALAVSAVQWLPTLRWAIELDRPEQFLWNLDLAGRAPATIREVFVQLLVRNPRSPVTASYAGPALGYVGAVTLVLIPAALFHRERRPQAFFFLVAAPLLFTAVVFGAGRLPLGFPSNVFVLPAVFCVAALAALGADRLLARRRGPRAPGVWAPALLVTVICGGLIVAASGQVRAALILAGALLVPAFFIRIRWFLGVCGCLLALLQFVDLSRAGVNPAGHPYEKAPECYGTYAAVLEGVSRQASTGRVILSSPPLEVGLAGNLGMLFPVRVAGGSYIPLTRDQATWWGRLIEESRPGAEGVYNARVSPQAAQPALLNAMAVRVLLVAPDGPFSAEGPPWERPRFGQAGPENDGGDVQVYVNEDALPRAYWVPSWRVVHGAAEAADVFAQAAGFEPARECVIDAASAEALSALRRDDTGDYTRSNATCSVQEKAPERIVVRVNAPCDGVTVLADTFTPGWRATLDGKPCQVLRANGLFRGIATPAGRHEIVFVYAPVFWRLGQGISLATLAVLVGTGAVGLVRRRKLQR